MKPSLCARYVAAFTLLPLLFVSLSAMKTPDEGTVIYGDDDRMDLYEVKNSRDLELAASTVALVEKNKTTRRRGRVMEIQTEEYGSRNKLCATERFYTQPAAAFCSGSLVGEDLVLTAGHCIENIFDCWKTDFVFGFSITEEGKSPRTTKAEDVVGCSSIVARRKTNAGPDFALVRLARKIRHRKPLRVNRGLGIRLGEKIGVIGHPSGLPTKVAFGDSRVIEVTPKGFFRANLDTYGGNSGSAVFNAETGLIEGILVRGEKDFVENRSAGCKVSYVCTTDKCRGEDVTLISEVAALIPEPDDRAPRPPRQWPKP